MFCDQLFPSLVGNLIPGRADISFKPVKSSIYFYKVGRLTTTDNPLMGASLGSGCKFVPSS